AEGSSDCQVEAIGHGSGQGGDGLSGGYGANEDTIGVEAPLKIPAPGHDPFPYEELDTDIAWANLVAGLPKDLDQWAKMCMLKTFKLLQSDDKESEGGSLTAGSSAVWQAWHFAPPDLLLCGKPCILHRRIFCCVASLAFCKTHIKREVLHLCSRVEPAVGVDHGVRLCLRWSERKWLRDVFDQEVLELILGRMAERAVANPEMAHWLACTLRFLVKFKNADGRHYPPFEYAEELLHLHLLERIGEQVLRPMLDCSRTHDAAMCQALITNISLCTSALKTTKEIRRWYSLQSNQTRTRGSARHQPGDALRRRYAPKYDLLDSQVMVDLLLHMGREELGKDEAPEIKQLRHDTADAAIQCLLMYVSIKEENKQYLAIAEPPLLAKVAMEVGKPAGLYTHNMQQGVAALLSQYCRNAGDRQMLYRQIVSLLCEKAPTFEQASPDEQLAMKTASASSRRQLAALQPRTPECDWIEVLVRRMPTMSAMTRRMSSRLYSPSDEERGEWQGCQELVDSVGLVVWGLVLSLVEGANGRIASVSDSFVFVSFKEDHFKKLSQLLRTIDDMEFTVGSRTIAATLAATTSHGKSAGVMMAMEKVKYPPRKVTKAVQRGIGLDTGSLMMHESFEGIQSCGLAMMGFLSRFVKDSTSRGPHAPDMDMLQGMYRGQLLREGVLQEVLEVRLADLRDDMVGAVAATSMYLCARIGVEPSTDAVAALFSDNAYASRSMDSGISPRAPGMGARQRTNQLTGGDCMSEWPTEDEVDGLMRIIQQLLGAKVPTARACAAAAIWCICRKEEHRIKVVEGGVIDALFRALQNCAQTMHNIGGSTRAASASGGQPREPSVRELDEVDVMEWTLAALYLLTDQPGVVEKLLKVQGRQSDIVRELQTAGYDPSDFLEASQGGSGTGLEILVQVVQERGGGSRTERLSRSRELSVMLLWLMCYHSRAAISQLIHLRLTNTLLALILDPSQTQRLRILSANLWIMLELKGSGANLALPFDKLTPALDFLKDLLDSGLEGIDNLVLRCFAILSARSEFRPELTSQGVLAIVCQFLQEYHVIQPAPAVLPVEYVFAIRSLYNITLHADCQVTVCKVAGIHYFNALKFAMQSLLRNEGGEGEGEDEAVEAISYISSGLELLHKNPANRTAMYKLEMQEKTRVADLMPDLEASNSLPVVSAQMPALESSVNGRRASGRPSSPMSRSLDQTTSLQQLPRHLEPSTPALYRSFGGGSERSRDRSPGRSSARQMYLRNGTITPSPSMDDIRASLSSRSVPAYNNSSDSFHSLSRTGPLKMFMQMSASSLWEVGGHPRTNPWTAISREQVQRLHAKLKVHSEKMAEKVYNSEKADKEKEEMKLKFAVDPWDNKGEKDKEMLSTRGKGSVRFAPVPPPPPWERRPTPAWSSPPLTNKSSKNQKKGKEPTIFKHVDGCQFCLGLFEHYELPTGELVHVYGPRGVPVTIAQTEMSEPNVGMLGAAGKDTLAGVLQSTLPDPSALLEALVSSPEGGEIGLKAATERGPVDIMVPEEGYNMLDSLLEGLRGSNVHLLLEVTDKDSDVIHQALEQIKKQESVEELDEGEWTLETSIFAPRKEESECKGFYDPKVILEKMFEIDFANMIAKERVRKMLTGAADKVHYAMIRHYDVLARAFDSYCVIGSGDNFTMQLNGFGQFCTDCNIADPKSKYVQRGHCDTCFVATNYTEFGKQDDKKKNFGDDSLVRHEFMEVILRLAVKKFLEGQYSGKLTGEQIRAAISRCFTECIIPNMQPEVAHDRNFWREKRLYKQEVDQVFQPHKTLLLAFFDFYKSPGHRWNRRMAIEDFQLFIYQSNLMIDHGVSQHDIEIAFVMSRLWISDPVTHPVKNTTLSFVDFLEALGRIADIVSPPDAALLLREGFGEYSHRPTYDYFQALIYSSMDPLKQRDSAGAMTNTFTRPLHVKLQQVLEIIIYMQCRFHKREGNPESLLRFLQSKIRPAPKKKMPNLFKNSVKKLVSTNKILTMMGGQLNPDSPGGGIRGLLAKAKDSSGRPGSAAKQGGEQKKARISKIAFAKK
ncbi:hypothetical protein CYMTET_54954, partial [Cymbomonas tetramitiformis]